MNQFYFAKHLNIVFAVPVVLSFLTLFTEQEKKAQQAQQK